MAESVTAEEVQRVSEVQRRHSCLVTVWRAFWTGSATSHPASYLVIECTKGGFFSPIACLSIAVFLSSVCLKQLAVDLLELLLLSAFPEMDYAFRLLNEEKHKFGEEPNPYLGHLAWADDFVITANSVSMLSEACSTGFIELSFLVFARGCYAQFLKTPMSRFTILSKNQLKRLETGGAEARINAWVDSMRASSPTHIKSPVSLSATDDQNSWIMREAVREVARCFPTAIVSG
ncbi:Mitochondrial fission protein ELM1-like [Dillenia turbinata]|uniref:Mitochondrial fission protein ELM1-like n=1 Tax=Dillenia turbinata TaxID=194707 RepID=A0AAN8VH41_9MAGN